MKKKTILIPSRVTRLIELAEEERIAFPNKKHIPTPEECRKGSKKALAFNRLMIKCGRTHQYITNDKVMDLKTERMIPRENIPEEYTTFQSVCAPSDPEQEIFTFVNNDITKGSWNKTLNLNNNYLLPMLIKQHQIEGDYIIKIIKGGCQILNRHFKVNKRFWSCYKDVFKATCSEFAIWNEDLQMNEKVVICFTREHLLPDAYYEQTFLDGVNHCFFQPIINFAKEMELTSKSKGVKERYRAMRLKIEGKPNTSKRKDRPTGKIGLIEKYKEGVPEKDLQEVCDNLQIACDIYQPFGKDKLIERTSQKKPLKTFTYINTRLNHLEANVRPFELDGTYESSNIEFVETQDDLYHIASKLRSEDKCFIYKKNAYGYTSIQSHDTKYELKSSYRNVVQSFEYEQGLKSIGFCAREHPKLFEFITRGTRFNETVDFYDTSVFETPNRCHPKDIKHIDMTKAFTQFHKSKFYSGFVGRITDFRQVTNYDRPGFYFIINLRIPEGKFKRVNEMLNWFHDNTIYTQAELKVLSHFDARFDVIAGAYGLDLDFRFPESMNEKEETVSGGGVIKKVPYYSKWIGVCYKPSFDFTFFMDGDRKHFESLKYPKHTIHYSDGTARITCPRKKVITRRHIASQIYAYQRINMLEQLLHMNLDCIVRLCVDGIYFYKHDFRMTEVFEYKPKMTFRNVACGSYIHHLDDDEDESKMYCQNVHLRSIDKNGNLTLVENDTLAEVKQQVTDGRCENPIFKYDLAKPRPFYKSELFKGAGGNGKTWRNLIEDTGGVDVCYVGHSWKLTDAMAKMVQQHLGIRLNVQVHHNFLYPPYKQMNLDKYGVVIWDECSMTTERQKKQLLETVKSKIIFCGDIGYQLSPICPEDIAKKIKKLRDREQQDGGLNEEDYYQLQNLRKEVVQMTEADIDNVVTLMKNYRFTCQKQKDLVDYVRTNIAIPIDFGKLGIRSVKRCDMDYNHKTDIILVKYNETNTKVYNKMFEDKGKYRSISNQYGNRNGSILFEKGVGCELRHGYTVHSVQGESFDGNIFIDEECLYKLPYKGDNVLSRNQMFYTAISRAHRIDQLWFVYK